MRFDCGSTVAVSMRPCVLRIICTYFRSSFCVIVVRSAGQFLRQIIFEIPALAIILPPHPALTAGIHYNNHHLQAIALLHGSLYVSVSDWTDPSFSLVYIILVDITFG